MTTEDDVAAMRSSRALDRIQRELDEAVARWRADSACPRCGQIMPAARMFDVAVNTAHAELTRMIHAKRKERSP